jgi:hypothetical protein
MFYTLNLYTFSTYFLLEDTGYIARIAYNGQNDAILWFAWEVCIGSDYLRGLVQVMCLPGILATEHFKNARQNYNYAGCSFMSCEQNAVYAYLSMLFQHNGQLLC